MGILRFSESVILSVAKRFLTIATNHLTALAKFGFTQQKLTDLGTKISTAEAYKKGDEQRTELKEQTIVKNTALDDCSEWGDVLLTRWKLAHSKNKALYDLFPVDDFNAAKQSENKMMEVMPGLISLSTNHNTELADKGQEADFPQQGTALLATLSAKDGLQEGKKDTNKSGTQRRYQLFKDLYDTVNEISLAGKKTFKKDPANLVLFESPWPKGGNGGDEGDGGTTQPPIPAP